jgi:GT2 family glycosyltransferase
MTKQTIAVIIPTLNRTFAVYNAALLLLHGKRPPDELIIVDQTPEDERNFIAFSELKALCNSGRCNYLFTDIKSVVHARNLGAANSNADILIFIDDDVFLPYEFLDRYILLFNDPGLAAATGMVLISECDDGTFKPLVQMESCPDEPTMLRGGNFAIRRSIFLSLGGMDENFLGASNYEDWDLAWRLHKAGYRAVWDPGPWIYHLHLPSGGGRQQHIRAFWEYAYNVHYFTFRHQKALGALAGMFRRTLRQFVFNKSNFFQPWYLPFRLIALASAIRFARFTAKAGPRLPFYR